MCVCVCVCVCDFSRVMFLFAKLIRVKNVHFSFASLNS